MSDDDEEKRAAERMLRSHADQQRSKFLGQEKTVETPKLPEEAVSYEEQERAIRALFDKRREEAKEVNAEFRAKELVKATGGINDPEMAETLRAERQRIEEKWAKQEAERLAAIARDEQARLDRLRDLYRDR